MPEKLKQYKGGLLICGIGFLTVGLSFLLDNLQIIDVAIIWPIIPIGIGLGMMGHHFLGRQ